MKKKIASTTPKNLAERATLFVAHVLDHGTSDRVQKDEGARQACAEFDRMLDRLLDEDYFGTEGQCDPRGDRRD
jgi:hypothetical protein